MAMRLKPNDFLQLSTFLTKYLPSSLKVYGAVQNAVEGELKVGIWVDVWPSPQAVVVKPDGEDKYIASVYSVFALDKSVLGSLLNDVVQQCDWQSSAVFAAIPKDYFPIIDDVATKYGCQLDTRDLIWADMYYVDEDSLQQKSLPEDMTFSKLTEAHVQLVNDNWEFTSGEESLSHTKWLIQNCPTGGLFDKNGDLVGFELMMYYGAMGMLHIMPEHRRKGYASYIVTAMSQKMFSTGRRVFVYLDHHNSASIRLHEKLGFIKVEGGPVTWVATAQKTCQKTCQKSCGKSKKCCV